MTRTRPLITAALIAATALAGAASPASAAGRKGSVRAAKKVLTGTAWSTYTSGQYAGSDRTVHLCGGGRFVLISSFGTTIIDDPSSYDHPYDESRTTGDWSVSKARLSADRRFGRVVVRYRTDDGQTGSVVFEATPRGTTMGGATAEVSRSSVC
jgi:hypothetical protein